MGWRRKVEVIWLEHPTHLGELSAVRDHDVALGLPGLGPLALHRLHHVHPVHHSPEHYVLPVQPCSLDGAEEKLGSVGVGPSVGHGQDSGASVLLLEVLVCELLPVDGLSPSPVTSGEVTALAHEVGDDSMELGPLVVEGLPR